MLIKTNNLNIFDNLDYSKLKTNKLIFPLEKECIIGGNYKVQHIEIIDHPSIINKEFKIYYLEEI